MNIVPFHRSHEMQQVFEAVGHIHLLSCEVTSGAKSRQIRSKWTPLGVHVCLDE
jgi:hypothetical protein